MIPYVARAVLFCSVLSKHDSKFWNFIAELNIGASKSDDQSSKYPKHCRSSCWYFRCSICWAERWGGPRILSRACHLLRVSSVPLRMPRRDWGFPGRRRGDGWQSVPGRGRPPGQPASRVLLTSSSDKHRRTNRLVGHWYALIGNEISWQMMHCFEKKLIMISNRNKSSFIIKSSFIGSTYSI